MSLLQRLASLPLVRRLYFGLGLPLLRRLPVASTVFGPVKGWHHAEPAALRRIDRAAARDDGGTWKLELAPARRIRNQAPVVCLPELPESFRQGAESTLPAGVVYQLAPARIATRQLEAIGPGDCIFDPAGFNGGAVSALSLALPRLPRMQRVPGRFATIATSRAANYYHWLNDCLPRLRLLEELGKEVAFRLLVPRQLSPFQAESLDLLGYGEARRAPFGAEHWRVDALLVPSLPAAPSQASPEGLAWLRARLLAAAPKESKTGPRRIFISRKQATKRRLLNEDAVVERLERRGFVAVATETLSFREQVRLFRDAEVVVAPHGAGLANLLFLPPDALVLELVQARRAKTCYVAMASAIGIRYAGVSDAPGGEVRDVDFAVPPERIDEALSRLEVR